MRGNQLYVDGRLYRFDYSGTEPPWPMQVWDELSQTWQPIGLADTTEPASSVLVAGSNAVVSADWLALSGGEAVTDSGGSTIACSTPQIAVVPDFVVCNVDVIGVGGA